MPSLTEGLAREGRAILGGDAAFALIQREATPEELALLTEGGAVSRVATLRAMARAPSGDATLVELKAVDPATYPLWGSLDSQPSAPLADLLACVGARRARSAMRRCWRASPSRWGRDQGGATRLPVARHNHGRADRLSAGVGFGPRLMVGRPLAQTGLIQPGSLGAGFIACGSRMQAMPRSRPLWSG